MRVEAIIEQAVGPEEDVELDARDLFEMANLYPDTVLDWFKRTGRGNQSRFNDVLRTFVESRRTPG